jgi:hypothetical protein
MSSRTLPWIVLVIVILVGLYFYTRPTEVTIVAPAEKSQSAAPAVAPSETTAEEPHELSPSEQTARDAAAAMKQLEHDQQHEMEKPLEPIPSGKDMATPPGEPTEKKP